MYVCYVCTTYTYCYYYFKFCQCCLNIGVFNYINSLRMKIKVNFKYGKYYSKNIVSAVSLY